MKSMKLRGLAAALPLIAAIIALGTSVGAAAQHSHDHEHESDYLLPPRSDMVEQLSRTFSEPPIAWSTASPAAHSEITLLMLYEPALPNAAARIDELIAFTNTVYAQSGIDLSFTLAAISPYTPSAARNSDVLREITNSSEIQNLRVTFGADMVTIIRDYDRVAHGGCGTAWVIGDNSFSSFPSQSFVYRYSYSVVSSGSDGGFFCSDLSLAHELGHNFGAVHDLPNTTIVPRLPYAYGYGMAGSFGTVMSYINPEVNFFSNPELTCNGFVCGNAGSGNVARAINDVRHYFAQLVPDATVPSPPSVADAAPLVDSVELFFQAGSDGGAPIESFTARCGGASVAGDSSPLLVTGLAPATSYECRVRATNSVGDSGESSIFQVSTLPLPRPEIERIDSWDGELTVQLAPAQVLGNYDLLGFTVTCGGETEFTTSTRAVIDGLINEQSYDCSAVANTSLGASPASASLAGIPEAATAGLNLILIQAALESE
ncbi:MAG: zinc-dependent metalloprotease family protein [Pseudomonadota bacterium]